MNTNLKLTLYFASVSLKKRTKSTEFNNLKYNRNKKIKQSKLEFLKKEFKELKVCLNNNV